MSGTSLDGIDAALIEIDGDAENVQWKLLAFREQTYTTAQREQIHSCISTGNAERLCVLHADLGEWLAAAALSVAAEAKVGIETVDVIGSHGQTVWHVPPSAGKRGATLQLGCASTIAERTGVGVVSDLRSRDVAAMGQGAPLVPWADRHLFAHPDHPRVLVNIGGMANLTWVPPRGSGEDILAFDTGPGNVLIDAAIEIATNGAASFDADGAAARAGTVDETLLQRLLAHEFFRMPPPRSTGREVFGREYVQKLVDASDTNKRGDNARAVVATLTELTARSIADSVHGWLGSRDVGEVIVTGGGARNSVLMERLADLLAPSPVMSGAAVGIHPDAKEAIVFAALAWAHVERVPGNMPAATGAAGPRILGSYTPGSDKGR